MKYLFKICSVLFVLLQGACDEDAQPEILSVVSARIGTAYLSTTSITSDVATNQPIVLGFSSSLSRESAIASMTLQRDNQSIPLAFSFADNDRTVTIDPVDELPANSNFTLVITDLLKGSAGETFGGATFSFKTRVGELNVLEWKVGGSTPDSDPIDDVPLTLNLEIQFSEPLNIQSVDGTSVSLTGPASPPLRFQFSADRTQLNIFTEQTLLDLAKYTLSINDRIKGEQGQTFSGFTINFYTTVDPEPDFPLISDEELLTLVQHQTFKYFWDFAHPASGMARERNTSGDLVTSGGSGFGIMALVVGIERNFITRDEGLQRIEKILSFLEGADRFHGAWPHWMDGNTGKVIPFSPNDDGGDLVETSFLIQGLLTFRQYLDPANAAEKSLVDRINVLWHGVEWDWYTRGENVLYWHWSPDKQWVMNHQIRGYNEALITYFLAAASPGHPVGATVYHQGWAGNGSIINNKTFYGFPLPLGYDYGGPLFFSHYSFLGLDPTGLQDSYANYWTQNVNHSRINHAYAVDNPKGFVGYSDENWGLTVSDNHQGYSAHSPTNDLGVISPTAALSSFPYTPEESLKALKFFYYVLGDRLWGPFGFYDAFNLTEGWTADSYLAIDQGPIIIMIENYRTGLLWKLFMSAPEVAPAMEKLGFTR